LSLQRLQGRSHTGRGGPDADLLTLLIGDDQSIAEDQKTQDQAHEEAQEGAAQSTPFTHHWVIRHLSHLRSSGVPGPSLEFILVMVSVIARSGIAISPVERYPSGSPIALPALKRANSLRDTESLYR